MTMHKLDRAACPAPACLGTYDHRLDIWDNVYPEHKGEIRERLKDMQGTRCAYCEGDLTSLGQHIEHFRRRCSYRSLTFQWNNLYWSCNKSDSCGHFKDHGAGIYNVEDLIDPCVHDPDHFFIFRSDGTISVRAGLSDQNKRRANETLRVFALDADWGRLRAMRKAAVFGYIKDADEAVNAGLTLEDIRAYFCETLDFIRELPFATAIRHVLTER